MKIIKIFFRNAFAELAKKKRKSYNYSIMKERAKDNITEDEAVVAERERKQFVKMTKKAGRILARQTM